MINTERINSIISNMKKSGEHVTVESIVIKSLFSRGGTVTEYEVNLFFNTTLAH